MFRQKTFSIRRCLVSLYPPFPLLCSNIQVWGSPSSQATQTDNKLFNSYSHMNKQFISQKFKAVDQPHTNRQRGQGQKFSPLFHKHEYSAMEFQVSEIRYGEFLQCAHSKNRKTNPFTHLAICFYEFHVRIETFFILKLRVHIFHRNIGQFVR